MYTPPAAAYSKEEPMRHTYIYNEASNYLQNVNAIEDKAAEGFPIVKLLQTFPK